MTSRFLKQSGAIVQDPKYLRGGKFAISFYFLQPKVKLAAEENTWQLSTVNVWLKRQRKEFKELIISLHPNPLGSSKGNTFWPANRRGSPLKKWGGWGSFLEGVEGNFSLVGLGKAHDFFFCFWTWGSGFCSLAFRLAEHVQKNSGIPCYTRFVLARSPCYPLSKKWGAVTWLTWKNLREKIWKAYPYT